MAFIGVDLHTNRFTVCRRQADGREQFATCQLAASDLARFCFGLDGDDAVAVEASGNSAWFCGKIRPCVGRIVVVTPKPFQVIRKSVKKTDPNDARARAFFLSKDMLSETRLKSVAERDLASKVHTRDGLVKQRTRLLNKIHALYVRHGVKLKKESLSSKRTLQGQEIDRFSALEQVELKTVRDQALSLTGALAEIDAAIEGTIEAAAKNLDGYDGIVSIKGIGTIADFKSADKLAAYLGIAPRVSQSNDTDHRGRITKRGNRLMRTTPVQCTLIALRYSGYLNSFYRKKQREFNCLWTILIGGGGRPWLIFFSIRLSWPRFLVF